MKLRQGVSRNCGHQLSESLTAAVTAGGGLSSLMAVFKSLNLCLWVSSWGFSQHGIWLPPEWMTQDRARLQDSNKMKVFNNLCLKVTCHLCVCCVFIVLLFVTPWTAAYRAPLSMGFFRQEYWSGLPFPPPGDLPDSGIKPVSLMSPVLADRFFTTVPPGKPIASVIFFGTHGPTPVKCGREPHKVQGGTVGGHSGWCLPQLLKKSVICFFSQWFLRLSGSKVFQILLYPNQQQDDKQGNALKYSLPK